LESYLKPIEPNKQIVLEHFTARAERYDHISEEDVRRWADNGAIDNAKQQAIQRCYAEASEEFFRLHRVTHQPGVVTDRMLFVVVIGTK